MIRLVPESTLLLVVDVQAKLVAAMPEESMSRLVSNASILLDAAKLLGVPVLATEQYPKGLGATIPALGALLRGAPMAKTTVDACSDLAIARAIADLAPRAVVVVGMEAHVCVYQTARELVARGFTTYVVADAVASRREENRVLGLSLCERAGALVAPAETVVFDWLEKAGTDDFKAVSKLVK